MLRVMRKNYVNVKNHRKNKGLSIRGVTLDDVIFIIISLNGLPLANKNTYKEIILAIIPLAGVV